MLTVKHRNDNSKKPAKFRRLGTVRFQGTRCNRMGPEALTGCMPYNQAAFTFSPAGSLPMLNAWVTFSVAGEEPRNPPSKVVYAVFLLHSSWDGIKGIFNSPPTHTHSRGSS